MRSFFSQEASSLLTQLLERDPSLRLGSSENGTDDIKAHSFFNDIDWTQIKNK